MPVAMRLPTPAMTRGRCKPTSGTKTSTTRCATPSCRRQGSRTFGARAFGVCWPLDRTDRNSEDHTFSYQAARVVLMQVLFLEHSGAHVFLFAVQRVPHARLSCCPPPRPPRL